MTRSEQPSADRRPIVGAGPAPPAGKTLAGATAVLAALAFLLVLSGPAGAQALDPCSTEPVPCIDPEELPVPDVPLPDEPIPEPPLDPGVLPAPEPPAGEEPDDPASAPDPAVAVGGVSGASGTGSGGPTPATTAPAPEGRGESAGDPSRRLEDAGARPVPVARTFAFPISLIVAVAFFLIAQWWVDRRDPKLLLAPDRPHTDLLTFE